MIGFLLTFCLYVDRILLDNPSFRYIVYGCGGESHICSDRIGYECAGYLLRRFQELFHHKQAKGSIGFYLLPLLILFLYVIEFRFRQSGRFIEHLQADPILFRLFRIGNYYRNILLSVRPVRPYC